MAKLVVRHRVNDCSNVNNIAPGDLFEWGNETYMKVAANFITGPCRVNAVNLRTAELTLFSNESVKPCKLATLTVEY